MKDEKLDRWEKDLLFLEEQIKNRKEKLMANYANLKPNEYIEGEWDCDKSLIGHCVYAWHDVDKTNCLFCHKPDERA